MSQEIRAKLHIVAPGEPEREYEITQPITRIGREPTLNDLVLAHAWVSRQHARIYADRWPLRIQDMRSSNGTSVNDRPLMAEEIRPLADGDIIAIGPFRLRYEASPPPPPPGENQRPPLILHAEPAPRLEMPPPLPPEPPPTAEERPSLPPQPWVGIPRDASRWLQYLPPIYSEDGFIGRYLLIFEDLLAPIEQIIGHFSLFLDPMTAPEAFIPWLSEWLAEIVDERWPILTKRDLLRHVSQLYQARGTRRGLEDYLRICTGCEAEIVENAQGPYTLHIVLRAQGRAVDRMMVERIVCASCPAHIAYTVEIT